MKLICLSKGFPVLKEEYLDEFYRRLEEGEIVNCGSLNIVEYLRRKTYKSDLEYRMLLDTKVYKIKSGSVYNSMNRIVFVQALTDILERT